MINLVKIKKEFPKSYEKLKEWAERVAHTFQHNLMEEHRDDDIEYPDVVIDDDAIYGLLVLNPRSLYDFFDENKIFISIDGLNAEFKYDLGEDEGWSMIYKTRPQVEEEAYNRAFELLNEKK